jgi:lipid A 4'-phosphatase
LSGSTEKPARASMSAGPLQVLADPIALCLVFTLIVSAFFLVFPGADMWVSGLFYAPGRGFPLAKSRSLILFRKSEDIAAAAVVVVILASFLLKLARPERPSIISPNASLFLLSSLIVGPGLLVNVALKGYWGRPRPVMVEAFGGADPYVEVWKITDYCVRNCSFVSGEASTAVWLTAIAFVVPHVWRLPVAIVAAIYAGLLSLNRLAFGGHFVSDVVISWGLTLLVIAVCHRLFLADPPSWLAPARLEEGVTRLGRRLRGAKA